MTPEDVRDAEAALGRSLVEAQAEWERSEDEWLAGFDYEQEGS